MTVMRTDMSSGRAAQWLLTRGREIAESGQGLSMATVAHPFGSHDDATAAAYRAACEEYRRTAELLGAQLRGAADRLRTEPETDGART